MSIEWVPLALAFALTSPMWALVIGLWWARRALKPPKNKTETVER